MNTDFYSDGQNQDECDLAWLTGRLIRVCRLETSKTPRNYTKVRNFIYFTRTGFGNWEGLRLEAFFYILLNCTDFQRSCVFKWIAAVASHVGKDQLNDWLPLVLPPLYREMTVQEGAGKNPWLYSYYYDLVLKIFLCRLWNKATDERSMRFIETHGWRWRI